MIKKLYELPTLQAVLLEDDMIKTSGEDFGGGENELPFLPWE